MSQEKIHHSLYSNDLVACEGRFDSMPAGPWDNEDKKLGFHGQEIDVYLLPLVVWDHHLSPLIQTKYKKLENRTAHCSLKDVGNSMLISRKFGRCQGQLRHLRLAKMLSQSYNLIVDFGMVVGVAIVELALAVLHHDEPMEAVVELAEVELARSEQLLEWQSSKLEAVMFSSSSMAKEQQPELHT